MNERGVRGNALDWARRECMDRQRWKSVCRGHPLGGYGAINAVWKEEKNDRIFSIPGWSTLVGATNHNT